MKNILMLGLVICCLCSCKKLAVRHTCTCEVKKTVNGVEEEMPPVTEDRLGTYSRAADSCTKLQDGLNYTLKTTVGIEIHSAECEIN